MARVIQLFDNLKNALTGTGTGRDVRAAAAYAATPFLTREQIDAAYRGSGLLRKIINIPAMDMVREWRDWKLEADQITAVEAEEKRFCIRKKVQQAEILRGLGGGALILGLPGDPAQPAPATIGKRGLAFVHVVSRWHLTFDTLEDDARQPGYGEPGMWRMMSGGQWIDIHPSRVIPFRGDTAATLVSSAITGADAFWGESVVAQVLDAVQDSDAARASFAALLHKARLLRIGIPGLIDMVASGQQKAVQDRLAILAQAESIHNATIFDAGDDEGKGGEKIEDVTYNFAGAKDVLNAYAEFVSAISDIPATRLLGRAPEGMNSSGDSQQADWRKKVRAMQTLDLAPCLDRLDPYLLQSAIGTVPEGQWYEFSPLDTPGEKENAERFYVLMQAAEKLANMAAIPERAFNRGLQSLMIEEGFMPELETALAEIPEDERWGVEPDPALDPGNDPQAEKGGDPQSSGEGGERLEAPPPRRAAMDDAAPRTLYVQRRLENADEFLRWAKAQGFETTLPADDLHVTITYSRQPLDWLKVENAWDGDDGKLTIPPGGARLVEPLGDKGAVVLLFNSSTLAWRHEQIKRAGASHDFDEYQPHVTITYAKPDGLDLANVEPYRGKLVFGPEIFEELDEDWASKLAEA